MKLIKQDLDFIWAQLRLVNNTPLNPHDSTGIRDVQGVGNNVFNPTWGSADTLFPRLTYNSLLQSIIPARAYDPATQTYGPTTYTVTDRYTTETGGFTGTVSSTQYGGPALSPVTYKADHVIDYATRGTTILDASPRIISGSCFAGS